jgi:cation diffusion facilitator CzcD-associated flavoprotein CzcO
MTADHVRVAIVGCGFSGLGMAIRLKQAERHDFLIFERSSDAGGTWRDNVYPGCQCDVPSHLYSYSFAPNPNWSRTYSPQAEIWDYLRECVHRFGVDPHIRYDHEVHDACWDAAARRWVLQTAGGTYTSDVLVFANGALAEPNVPDIKGAAAFEGQAFHSARWPSGLDLAGKRVAVIGTGASAIQIVPTIQPVVEQLDVYQRTPGWVMPHSDRPIGDGERRLYRAVPGAQRLVRALVYWLRELLVFGMVYRPQLMRVVAKQGLAHLHRQIADPELRRKLTPSFSAGCKRLMPSNHFYPALTRDNVELVTDRITEITPKTVRTADGREREVDVIVYATGFEVTNNPMMMRVRGRHGRSLTDEWENDGVRAYLGTTVPDFPNLFLMTGPNTGIGHTSLLVMIEAQIDYILDALRRMSRGDLAAVDVRREAYDAFDAEIRAKMRHSVWTTGGCSSWYLGPDDRNSTLWPDFTFRYRRRTRRFDIERYNVEPVTS